MKLNHLIITILLIGNTFIIHAQSLQYKRFQFDWPVESPKTIALSPQNQTEDVIILDDKTEMFLNGGEKANFLKKYYRMRINTSQGLKKASHLILPESFYPQADYAETNTVKRASIHEPTGGYESMEYIAGRIIKPDGRIIPAIITDSVEFQKYTINMKTTTYYSFHFRIKNLEIGDDIEINYGIRTIYNATNIIFFHGNFPKLHSSLTIKYNADEYKYYFIEHNGAKGVISPIINGKYTEQISYEFSDLPGCMIESNSRPFKELPYVNFYKHDLNYGVWNDSRTVIQKYLPYSWDYINLYFVRYEQKIVHKDGFTLDKDAIAIRNYLTDRFTDFSDSTRLGKSLRFHNDIAYNFKYQRDDKYYEGTDYRLPRIPEFLEKRTLREISRYTIYEKIYIQLGFDYYITYLMDKRINKINFERYEGLVAKDVFFCIVENNKVNYFQPKFHQFGYFANELPFYYEDVPCILIPQRVPEEERSKNVKSLKYVYINTPFSTLAENTRSVNVLTTVSLDSLKINYHANIKLSGQFSTMTRGAYLFNFVDTTVTKQYGAKIYDDIFKVINGNTETVSIDSLFPFKSEFNVKYYADNSVLKNEDKTFEINISNWFKHIHDTLVTTEGRNLVYYPDFMYQDRWKYYIKFDKPVKIVSVSENIELAGDPCAYRFNASQLQPDVIMLESVLLIKNESVQVASLGVVEKSYKAIAALNNSRLIVSE